jgi:hypothetical protein
MDSFLRSSPAGIEDMAKRIFCIIIVALAWLATTWLFWSGYSGADDLFYCRYAYLFHRLPINHMEYRIPAVLAIRASFLLLGPSEFAACLPMLLASLAMIASIAWFVDWPRTLNWQTQTTMLLASVLPMDVWARSYPMAIFLAAGLLALGTVCILKGTKAVPFLGAALLALAFETHELSFFYVAIFCLIALAFDWQKYWRPVLACAALSAVLFLAECTAYQVIRGDFLARFRWAGTAINSGTYSGSAYDPDTHVGGLSFYLWPISTLIFSKPFGLDLVALFLGGLFAWRYLDTRQRILFLTTFLVWLWWGYGTQIPWMYKPVYRQFHYYDLLVLGVATLLPPVLAGALAFRPRMAQGMLGAFLAIHLFSLAAAGRYGQTVAVAGELLRYAQQHPKQVFLTDVSTMNLMYTLGGFQLPPNVVCLDGPAVERHLLVNKEPPERPSYRFPEVPHDGILVNLEPNGAGEIEPEFIEYLQKHSGGEHRRLVPIRYRSLYLPLLSFMGPKDFMVKSLGGEVVQISSAPHTAQWQQVSAHIVP